VRKDNNDRTMDRHFRGEEINLLQVAKTAPEQFLHVEPS